MRVHDSAPRRADRRTSRARTIALALATLVGFGSLSATLVTENARAQIPPPPAPCSGEPPASGPCPASACTTDVPGASEYQNSLPVPTPREGFNYVVQLVNESDVTILAAANAAHRGSSTPGGMVPAPTTVEPREGTWVMLPKGSPNNGNILTIDIPQEWEGTQCPDDNKACGANGPRFFPRTGCKYDIERNLAQCETGSCGDAYDCGKQALRNPPLASAGKAPVSIVEWTFNSQGGQGYNYPDISLVDGVSITVDVQAIGLHCAQKPGVPTEPNWLSENQPLAIHGADLREPDRCIPSFRLTRGEVGQIVQGGSENPDDVVACFTNCGRYEYPRTPDLMCDPTTDERCRNWRAFCCFAPAGDPDQIYGGPCSSDNDCRQNGACWDRGNAPLVCACRAFLKDDPMDCPADVCTHPNPPNMSAQPEFGRCSDVTDDPTACIGDDTIHRVFPGGYTWPNDPQTYVSDARAYRIIFSPGGNSVAITDSGPIAACDTLPEPYGFDIQSQVCKGNIDGGALFAGAALSPACEKTEDCPIIPGSNPAARYGCDPLHKRCSTWACQVSPGGPVPIGALICRWPAAMAPTPTATPTRGFGGPQPTEPPGTATATPPPGGSSSSGCAIDPDGADSSALVLVGLVAGGILLRTRPRRAAVRVARARVVD